MQSRLLTVFSALRHRNFRLFISGQCISLIGTFIQAAAQQWLVYSITKSPFLLGLLGVFQFGPVFLLSLLAGVYIDRFPKRKLLLATQTTFMLQSLILAYFVWTGHVQYWEVAMLAVVYGIAQTFDLPVRQSFVIELVGREDLMNAISLNSTAVNISKIIGPTIAGVVIVNFGVKICFLLNGLSFIPVIFGVYLINATSFIQSRSGVHPIAEIKNGIVYMLKSRLLFFTAVMMLLVSTFSGNTQVILPVFATDVLKRGAAEYSYLLSAMGVGALIGALFMAWRSKRGVNTVLMVVDAAALAAVQILAFFFHGMVISSVMTALIGLMFIIFLNMANSTLQIGSSNEYRGRVMSVYSLLLTGTSPLGNSFVGYVMQKGGGGAGFLMCGIFTLVLAAPFALYQFFRHGKPSVPAKTA